LLPIVTEIYLCHTCSCHEILRMETPGQVLAHAEVGEEAADAVGRAELEALWGDVAAREADISARVGRLRAERHAATVSARRW
jgi:hypothetical protein